MRGWDEFELEVMRDTLDNVVVVCSIENLDPMGVHTGDSVTVAPQMTLSDEAYQELRDAAAAVIRAVGVECGGSNIQFARDRETGDIRVIEMNPRVSRSSALASKATGYPIAKVAAKLAVGYTLDEIPNDLTGTTPASFEPTLDYVVVKFPRFAFEKFPGADTTLGTQMKSVGEAMGIGRTFAEAFAKAMASRELDRGAVTPWADLDDLPEDLHPWFRAELDSLRLREGERVYRRVDSVAGEVEAASNYYYSTIGERDEALPAKTKPRVVVLGSGPNRIGQGIEFDYCCVHAAKAFRSLGHEAVMVNCNPETVSTDYDTSDRLYFEPLTEEYVLAVCEREQPDGVVIQFGGQTPLKLAHALDTPASASSARRSWRSISRRTASASPACLPSRAFAARSGGSPTTPRAPWRSPSASAIRCSCGPSYVLGGRAMRVCYRAEQVVEAFAAGPRGSTLVDRFLEGALEIDIDALCDGRDTYVAAVMEHVEEAGVHSGDSSCALPAPSLDPATRDAIDELVSRLAPALGVVGLVNIQLAIVDGEISVLEANPRASRTVPFASKATGVNLVEAACRLMAGAALSDLALPRGQSLQHVCVKAAVFPFARFPGSDPVLGPEMRSTGEVMATAEDFATAFGKAERAAGRPLPESGTAFISVRDADKQAIVPVAAQLADLGFEIVATAGTAGALAEAGIEVGVTAKVSESEEEGATVVDLVRRGRCDLVVNTPNASGAARSDGYLIREAALAARIPCVTTVAGAAACVQAIAHARTERALSLQERLAATATA